MRTASTIYNRGPHMRTASTIPIEITPEIVWAKLNELNPNKSPGHDNGILIFWVNWSIPS